MPRNETSVLVQQQSTAEFPKPSTSPVTVTMLDSSNTHLLQQQKSGTFSRQSKVKPENINIHPPRHQWDSGTSSGQSSDCWKDDTVSDPESAAHHPGCSGPTERQKEVRGQRSSTPVPVPGDQDGDPSQAPERRTCPDAENCAAMTGTSLTCVSTDPCPKGSPATTTTSTPTITEKINTALHTLKSELMAMREQDLQLLKQLIHINDNIRRLKRTRWLQRGGARTVSCELLGTRTNPAATTTTTTSATATTAANRAASRAASSSTSPLPSKGGGVGGVCCGSQRPGGRVSLLQRQRSEPGLLLGVPHFSFARTTTSVGASLTSTSSSFETIEDEEEEADSLYGSYSDLPSDTSPTSSPFSPGVPAKLPFLPTTPLTRTSPSSCCPYASLTFTQEELWRGESSYGEILKRNVRLWKWSVAHEREAGGGVDGGHPGHPCVL